MPSLAARLRPGGFLAFVVHLNQMPRSIAPGARLCRAGRKALVAQRRQLLLLQLLTLRACVPPEGEHVPIGQLPAVLDLMLSPGFAVAGSL